MKSFLKKVSNNWWFTHVWPVGGWFILYYLAYLSLQNSHILDFYLVVNPDFYEFSDMDISISSGRMLLTYIIFKLHLLWIPIAAWVLIKANQAEKALWKPIGIGLGLYLIGELITSVLFGVQLFNPEEDINFRVDVVFKLGGLFLIVLLYTIYNLQNRPRNNYNHVQLFLLLVLAGFEVWHLTKEVILPMIPFRETVVLLFLYLSWLLESSSKRIKSMREKAYTDKIDEIQG